MAKPILLALCLAMSLGSLRAQSHTLYSVIGDTLVTLDLQTGDASSIGFIGGNWGEIGDLAYHPPTDQLVGIAGSVTNPFLLSFNRSTGFATSLGAIDLVSPSLNVRLCEGLAYDDITGEMYVAVHENTSSGNWWYSRRLGTLDISNGEITQVATVVNTLQDDIDGMVFRNGTLLAFDGNASFRGFYSVNPSTGVSTLINSISHRVPDMAVHPVTNQLYACSNGVRELIEINPTNAQVNVLGNTHSTTEYNGGRILGVAFAPSPVPNLGAVGVGNNLQCWGDFTGTISVTASNGTPPITFSLNGAPPSTSGNFTGLSAGSYSVLVQDAAGNDTTLSFILTEPPLLTLTATTTDAQCMGILGSASLSGQGGTPGYLYAVNNGAFSPNSNFPNLQAGSYTGHIQDVNGCETSITFDIESQSNVALVLDSLLTGLCPGDPAQAFVSASGGNPPYTYSLAGGQGQASGFFSNLLPGSYTVETIDANGCPATLPLVITDVPPLNADFTFGAPPCVYPAPVEFAPNDLTMSSYSWDFGDGSTSNLASPLHSYLNPGNYTVQLTVTDVNGCMASSSQVLSLSPLPEAEFSSVPSIPGWSPLDAPVSFLDQSNHAHLWEWDFGDGYIGTLPNPQHTYATPGNFCVTLTVSNLDGCRDSTVQCSLQVLDESLFIPSAFTPNGDQLNDEFAVVASFFPDDFDMKIYNRWGQMIYQTDTWGNFWQGTFQGQPAQEGVYTWVLRYTSLDGRQTRRQGTVTLVR